MYCGFVLEKEKLKLPLQIQGSLFSIFFSKY